MTKDEMAEKHMPLIKHLAAKWDGKMVDYEEAVSIGLLGLAKAINGFNTEATNKFSSYAYVVIENDIKTYIRKCKEKWCKEVSINDEYADNLTTEDALACDMDVEAEAIRNINKEMLYAAILTLPDRKRRIIGLHFMGYDQRTIAKALGITQSWVSYVLIDRRGILKRKLYKY